MNALQSISLEARAPATGMSVAGPITEPWGATAAHWALFSDTLGLKADLLPVVSNPKAVISKGSKMAALGKTPSQYNRDHEAAGIVEWTRRKSDDRDIARWAKDSDLGICVQTRRVRAIDIDVSDAAVAARVRDVVELALDMELPRRWRADSGKCLLAFTMPGEFTKRIIRMAPTSDGGRPIIEFLANGQQMVVCGTHPSGQRYQWKWPTPSGPAIPEITPAQFEGVWRALAEQFGEGGTITGRGIGQRPLVPRTASSLSDLAVDFLEATGWVKSWQKDGRVNVRCPWEAEHTSDSGETATVWFPAGVGGFDKGNFRCLHAHCEHRTREQFFEAVGYAEDIGESFEVVEAAPGEVQARPNPLYQRKRNGEIIGCLPNVVAALARPDVCLRHIALDAFRDEIVLAPWSPETEGQPHLLQWRAFSDADYGKLKVHLERGCGFENVSIENLRMGVLMQATDNRTDSAIEWLRHRVPAWDGVPRVDMFLSRYLRAADTPYTRAVSAYLLTGMAGRILDPGCQADMVPVLVSGEGTGKTSSVKLLLPDPRQHYVEINLQQRDDDLARSMRGKLLGEIAELRGLNTRDEESIKAWVTRTHEEWTPKYREFGVQFPRRLMFVGTSNAEEGFLANDGSAARRWLPARVGETDKQALTADRDQLWAEARERFLRHGVEWQGAHELGREARDEHRVQDDWQPVIEAWLAVGEMDDPAGPPRGLKPVLTVDVLTGAIGMPLRTITRKDQERAARVLKALGYVRKKPRIAGMGTTRWAYCPTEKVKFLHVSHNEVDDLA